MSEPTIDTPEILAALRNAGWAPGLYVFRCSDPQHEGDQTSFRNRPYGDKRSSRCRPCAERALAVRTEVAAELAAAEAAVDTGTEAVEKMAADLWSVYGDHTPADSDVAGAVHVLRALAAERDAAESARVEAVRLLSDASALYARTKARAEAAEARASEHGAYRTAAAAFLASKGMLPEFDAWCEARGMPADAVGALVEVARKARAQRESASAVSSMIGHRPGPERQSAAKDLGATNRELWAALDALPSGILDHSDG